MSVIIRLQNLPWSANAMDIRNFFRGLSIPEGGVHIVGGEQGDAFIAFSTDEDARQAMMLNDGKLKEIQVKLLLSSRSEMHKVIEQARQQVPILQLQPQPPVPPQPLLMPAAHPSPFAPALAQLLQPKPVVPAIPGLGSPNHLSEPPQPAVIEPPAPVFSVSPTPSETRLGKDRTDDDKRKDKGRRRSRSRSREKSSRRDKKDRRERSRSRDRRRRSRTRSRSRSRERRDRRGGRDRRSRSRSRERSRDNDSRTRDPERRGREKRDEIVRGPAAKPQRPGEVLRPGEVIRPAGLLGDKPPSQQPDVPPPAYVPTIRMPLAPNAMPPFPPFRNGPAAPQHRQPTPTNGFDNNDTDALTRLQQLRDKRNPHAFQGGVLPPNMSTCVRLLDVPNDAGYGDVRRFFSGYMIADEGVKMINDAKGRRTGVVLVRFADLHGKLEALRRSGRSLKDGKVRIEHVDEAEFDAAIDAFLPVRRDADPTPEPPKFTILKLSSLPPSVKEHDIIKKLSDYSLLSLNMTDCRETKTRVAYVQFAKADDARQAYERRHLIETFNRKTVTIAPCGEREYEQAKLDISGNGANGAEPEKEDGPEPPRDPRQRRPPPDEAPPAPVIFPPAFPVQLGFPPAPFLPPAVAFPPPINAFPQAAPAFPPGPPWSSPAQLSAPPDCVLVKGLSSRSTDRTIIDFFAEADAVPARIHLMLDNSGRPSGDCFCEFRTPEDASRAAKKHGNTLEGRVISVDLVDRQVVEDALEGPKRDQLPQFRAEHGFGAMPAQFPAGMPGQTGPSEPRFDNRGGFQQRGFSRGRGGFERGRGGFERGRGGFERGRGGFERGRGGFERGGFERGRGAMERGAMERAPMDRGPMDRGPMDRGPTDRGAMERGGGRGRGGLEFRGRGRAFASRFAPTDSEAEPPSEPEGFGQPGCVVGVENVPYRAEIDEILQFFGDFELNADDVIRRFDDRGRPTGEARVCFRTPFDAQRAVQTLDGRTVRERVVRLGIV